MHDLPSLPMLPLLRPRRAVLAVLLPLAALSAACDLNVVSADPAEMPAVEVLTARTTPGDPVSLRMENGSPSSWGYNACSSPALQRREGDAWVDAPAPLILCTTELTSLAPGAARTLSVAVPLGYVPGTYRVRFRFLREDGTEVLPATNAFTVE